LYGSVTAFSLFESQGPEFFKAKQGKGRISWWDAKREGMWGGQRRKQR